MLKTSLNICHRLGGEARGTSAPEQVGKHFINILPLGHSLFFLGKYSTMFPSLRELFSSSGQSTSQSCVGRGNMLRAAVGDSAEKFFKYFSQLGCGGRGHILWKLGKSSLKLGKTYQYFSKQNIAIRAGKMLLICFRNSSGCSSFARVSDAETY